MPITRESRTEMALELVKLSIAFAFQQASKGASFSDVLTGQTPIYRLTALWDGTHHPAAGNPDPHWTRWLEQVARLTPGESAEQHGLNLLRPVLEAGIDRDLKLWPWTPDTYGRTPTGTGTYGFFLYNFGSIPEEVHTLHLHMGNAWAPQSPFDEPAQRVRELQALLADALKRCPDLNRISCGSWLNQHPTFLQFFPPAWKASAQSQPVGFYFNWWGQFITRTGGFHFKNGLHLRQTGDFPFQSVICQCTPDEFRAHLEKISQS